jgi:glycosyltransferase involved in cell wall biosynthesis
VARTVPLPLVVVMTSFDPGGTERQMIELLRRLDRGRWSVEVASFLRRGPLFDSVAAIAPVTVFPVSSFLRPAMARALWSFARWCRDKHVAVVHTAEVPANIFGLPGAALGRVPVRIGNRREINPDKTAATIAIQRAAYTCAHRIVANSNAAAERLQAEGVPAAKISVVRNGLDLERFPPAPRRAAPRRVVIVANLRREKGHDVLIDAAPDVLRRFPDARFDVVGAGPELNALLDRARNRGVAHAFAFLGHREDVADRLAASDIFVLPSRSEASPNALLEAMAAGLPVIASAVGGVPEIVDDDRTGLLVKAGNCRVLAERLCQLMADPSRGGRIGDAARREVASRFSFDRMVAAFEQVYVDELTRRGVIGARQPQWAAS